jgi:hypothetical protein
VSELCQIALKPRSNIVSYGDTLMHTIVAEVVDGECVGARRCASARAAGIYFQACSFNQSNISDASLRRVNRDRQRHDVPREDFIRSEPGA